MPEMSLAPSPWVGLPGVLPASLPSGASVASYTTCPAGDTTDNAIVTLTYNGSALVSVPGIPLSPPSITSTASFRCGG